SGISYYKTYYYRLCVTYKEAKKASGVYSDLGASSDGKYNSYLYITSHIKGEACYNLQTDGYGSIVPMDAVQGSTTSTTKQ
ncbi:MAG: hypothetical protein ABIP74_01295, partial [Candidatus Saccharimonas sp.]